MGVDGFDGELAGVEVLVAELAAPPDAPEPFVSDSFLPESFESPDDVEDESPELPSELEPDESPEPLPLDDFAEPPRLSVL